MSSNLPAALAVLTALCVVIAAPLYFAGRRAAAVALNGVALALTCAGALFAMADNVAHEQPNNASAWGLGLLSVLAAMALLCLVGARRPALQAALYWPAQAMNLAVLGSLLYLLFSFKIF